MERIIQNSKKNKPNKYVEKEKSSSFITDVRTLKENLKINEILKTVKMNSSMRIKAPRGSKVMHNKDFNDHEDIFDNATSSEGQNEEEPPSATNTILNTKSHGHIDPDVVNIVPEVSMNSEVESNTDVVEPDKTDLDPSYIHNSKNPKGTEHCAKNVIRAPISPAVLAAKYVGARSGDRKLSLDHTMLLRREGLSQSEVDLNSIGKLPLERKSSFFRKKMDSFLKNTTEIFKWQSLNNKSTRSPLTSRRGSVCSRMSVSMQSLNENSVFYGQHEATDKIYPEQHGSVTSLRSSATPARSNSTVSVNVSDRPPDLSEEESLAGSQLFADTTSTSFHSLNESYAQESLLNTRAISMSSGLDTASGKRRLKSSRSNRVSWLASESLTDYFRRLVQDEKSQATQEYRSYHDVLSIPENIPVGPRPDSKGRRLSYVRAVSGEDPVLPSRYQESSFRRKKIPENETKAFSEMEAYLALFERNGIPELEAFAPYKISGEGEALLKSLDSAEAIEKYLDLSPDITTGLSVANEMKQEIIKEFIYTETAYIYHLNFIVKVYIATAHALQSCGVLMHLNTSTLFAHIPDVLNSNMRFWERTALPTLLNAKENKSLFDPNLLLPGLYEFAEIFNSYYDYTQSQKTALDYYSSIKTDPEFCIYSDWCYQQTCDRLKLDDMLAKPMQRLTKYHLIISRLAEHVDDELKRELDSLDYNVRRFASSVNRAVRLSEELLTIEQLRIEPYEPNFKGNEDMEQSYKKFHRFHFSLPMIECGPYANRCLVHQGILRYKDYLKEFDSQVLIFTDMILVCRKYPKKKDSSCWKMLRPKILLHRIVPNIKQPKSIDPPTLTYVELDEQGSSKGVFQLLEPRDHSTTKPLKEWEHLIYEAIMSYTLTKWYYKYPVRDLMVIEKSYSDENFKKENPDLFKDEANARLRVAATFHATPVPDFTKDVEIHMSAIDRERGPPHLHLIFESGLKNFNARQTRSSSLHHQSTTSRSSHHRSSSELHNITSYTSHEEIRSVSLQRSGSSVEHNLPSWFFNDVHRSPSITVNVVAENDSIPSPPTLVLQEPSPHLSPGPRSASACGDTENTLRVTPLHTVVHSMPDINAELHLKPEPRVVPHTASAKLYRSHQELIQRNRLAAGQHYLNPDSRGSSYPPPSPTRTLLKRGLAFSYSFKSNPPLTRSANVRDTSQVQIDIPSDMPDKPRRLLLGNWGAPSRADLQRSPTPPGTSQDLCMPSTSEEKSEKKSLFLRRTKGARSASDHSENLEDKMETSSIESCVEVPMTGPEESHSKQAAADKPTNKEKEND